jgi:acyl dehydratase
VRSLDARFRRPIYLDDRIQWVALVTGTEALAAGSAGVVRLDLYFENERGERPVQAVVLVELPRQD